ncbi:MAG: hypothetical protein WCK78_11845 [Paludibacter sp.]
MKRYQLDGTYYYCPVDLTLSVIGGRWKGLVVICFQNHIPYFHRKQEQPKPNNSLYIR